MKRRRFIQKTTMGVSLLSSNIVRPFISENSFNSNALFEKDQIDPIIPIKYYPKYGKEILSDIKRLREDYGFRRFLITEPSKEYRYIGFPEKGVFEDIGNLILGIKNALKDYDVEIGWWCVTTIRIGNGRFQGIIKPDGSIAQESPCPLDAEYKRTFSDYIGIVTEIARPFLINFEDDYHLNGGCFCPLHLEEFAERQKRSYTREELNILLNESTLESYKIKEEWGRLKRESLANLAKSVRRRVDEYDKTTRLCLCQSGASERDGNFTQAVTQAFAGETRPIVRVHGSSYLSDDPLGIPRQIFNCLYQRQYLPKDFELIHEADSFPHTRFFMSSSKLKSFMTAAYTYGLDGSLLYINQYLENPLEESGFRDMYNVQKKRFNTLRHEVRGCETEGCEIFRNPGTSFNWTNITGRMGIPHASKNGRVKLVSGGIINQLSDEEIKNLLKGSVFLDGEAAFILSERGFSEMIGGQIRPRSERELPPFYEGVVNPNKYEDIDNRLMYNYVWAFARNKNKAFYEIESYADTEVVTEFLNTRNESYYPAMIKCINRLGGRVAITAFNLGDGYVNTKSISLFNYSKKKLLRQVIEWLGEEQLPVYIKDVPNVFCIYSKAINGDYGIVTVTGLNSDTFESFTLDVSPERNPKQVFYLNDDGNWQFARISRNKSSINVDIELSVMNPVVLKLIYH